MKSGDIKAMLLLFVLTAVLALILFGIYLWIQH